MNSSVWMAAGHRGPGGSRRPSGNGRSVMNRSVTDTRCSALLTWASNSIYTARIGRVSRRPAYYFHAWDIGSSCSTAARRLLEQRGYAHITARDLVAESDTNLASIGYHFGSKAGLLNAAIESAFEDWTDQLAALVMADPHATPDPAWRWRPGWPRWRACRGGGRSCSPTSRRWRRHSASPELQRQLAAHYAASPSPCRRAGGAYPSPTARPQMTPVPIDRHLRHRGVRRAGGAVVAGSRAFADRRASCSTDSQTVWAASGMSPERLPARVAGVAAAGDLAHGGPHVGEIDRRQRSPRSTRSGRAASRVRRASRTAR